MGYPNVLSGTNGGSPTITLPSFNAGDMIVVLAGSRGSTTDFAAPSGWTRVAQENNTADSVTGAVIARIMESGDSGTLVLTGNGDIADTYRVLHIEAGTFTGLPQVSARAIGISNAPNSPSFTHSGGNVDTLWLSMYWYNANISLVSAPTDYVNPVSYTQAPNNSIGFGIAERQTASDTEDPGAFTASGSNSWVALTVAILGTSGSTSKIPIALFF